jgi:threonine aldolase
MDTRIRRIDLRSDTVTLPTEEMMKAIESAELGDDVYEEDPTVNRLQDLAAKKTGKDAALLVTSGTQANLVSLLALTQRGQEIIVERDCHMYYYEVGGMSAIAGLIPRPIEGTMGYMEPERIERELREKDIHYPPTGLVCLENTHNRAGGTVITPKQMEAVHDLAKSHELPLYVDGARIFNAAVALRTDVRNFRCDAMMFCLSKGLSAPIGSLICGSDEFIDRARKFRKMLGGGMRQAGIIAACGIVAIEKMTDRLADDHRNARLLAEELSALDGITVDMSRVQTNMVYFDVSGLGMKDFIGEMSKRGVMLSHREGDIVRAVTHRGIEREDILETIERIKKLKK